MPGCQSALNTGVSIPIALVARVSALEMRSSAVRLREDRGSAGGRFGIPSLPWVTRKNRVVSGLVASKFSFIYDHRPGSTSVCTGNEVQCCEAQGGQGVNDDHITYFGRFGIPSLPWVTRKNRVVSGLVASKLSFIYDAYARFHVVS
jgi:hypothetical protein